MFDAYVAGLVDGDGSIIISKVHWGNAGGHTYGLSPDYRVTVQVTSVYRPVLEELVADYGGSISNKPLTRGSFFTRRKHYNWSVAGRRAVAMLERIRPYLRIKEHQAWLALEFWAQRTASQGGGNPVPPGELALRDGFYWAMKTVKGTI